jgi:hypothetical protein
MSHRSNRESTFSSALPARLAAALPVETVASALQAAANTLMSFWPCKQLSMTVKLLQASETHLLYSR